MFLRNPSITIFLERGNVMSIVSTVSNSDSGLLTLLAELKAELSSSSISGASASSDQDSSFMEKLQKEIAELESEIAAASTHATSASSSSTPSTSDKGTTSSDATSSISSRETLISSSGDHSNGGKVSAMEMAKALKQIEEMQAVWATQSANTVDETLARASSRVSAASSLSESSINMLR